MILHLILFFLTLTHAFEDPSTWVTCNGPLPPFEWSLPRLAVGEQPTLQHICANVNNGGKLGYTVGGFCAERTVSTVADRLGAGFQRTSTLAMADKEFRVIRDALQTQSPWLRLSQYCMQRCRCNVPNPGQSLTPHYYTEADLRVRPNVIFNLDDPRTWTPVPPAQYGYIDLPNPDNLLLEYADRRSGRKYFEISAYSAPMDTDGPSIVGTPRSLRVTRKALRLKPDHEIECAGPLPSFPLPGDVDPSIYEGELQQLCATPLGGGNNSFSAGAYCRLNPLDANEGDIDFADEMTPHPDWTWDGSVVAGLAAVPRQLPPRGIRVRNYCWNKCICPGGKRRPKRRLMGPIWKWFGELQPWMLDSSTPKSSSDVSPPKYDGDRPASVGCFNIPSCIVMSLFGPQPQCKQGTAPPDAQYMCQLDDKGAPITPLNNDSPQSNFTDVTVPDVAVNTKYNTTAIEKQDNGEAPMCYDKCSTVNRGCPYEYTGGCRCGAPRINLFFWFQASCLTANAFLDFSQDRGLRRRAAFSKPTRDATKTPAIPLSPASAKWALKKRDVSDENPVVPDNVLPAPCNASYVSVACANSTDGIVYEPPEMWLGAVLPANWTIDEELPRVPDEFFTVHNLVRAGDASFRAEGDGTDQD